jgi:protease-4
MKHFLLTMCGVFAGLLLFLVGIPILLIAIAAGASGPEPTPARTVVELDLREVITDQDSANPFASFGQPSLTVLKIVTTLRRAATDDHVRGLLIRLPESGLQPAMADEIADSLRRFRKTGKPVIVFSQGVYPAGATPSTYMLAAAGGQVWMQPGASLQATGLVSEDIFLKRLFDRYGVRADFEQRKEFKNAVNGYLNADYTDAHREATRSMLESIYSSALNRAAADRRQSPAQLKAALESGPLMADEALRLNLIDRVDYLDAARKQLADRAGQDAQFRDFRAYARSARDLTPPGRPAIAIVTAEGGIVTGGGGGDNPFAAQDVIYSDVLEQTLRDAVEDKDVKAIVLRVSSPGGSDTASEQVRRAVEAAKAAGKPVVVSMGPYAASGGYWISSNASAIVAQPTTLTGSIGVFGGKIALGEALARVGVDLRQIGVGSDYASAFSVGSGLTEAQRAAFGRWMDQIYARFIARVAEGRRLPVERVEALARGRVWTGAQARELGLIDQVGGFYDAVDRARALSGVNADMELKWMATEVTPLEAFETLFGMSGASIRTLAAAAWVLGDPRAEAVLNEMAWSRMPAGAGAVRTPALQP